MENQEDAILKEIEEMEAHKAPHKPNIPLICAFLVLAASVLPLLILHSNNTGIRFLEVLLPTGIILAAAVVLFLLLWLITRKPLLAAMMTAVIILMAMGFHLFRRGANLMFSGKKAAWAAIIIWLIVLAALIFLLIRIRKVAILPQIAEILCIVMAVLIAFNAIRIVPALIRHAELNNYPSQSPAEAPVMTSEEEMKTHTVEKNGRNFYWIILDEYADDYTMQTYFGREDDSFTKYLQDNGFSVSTSSYSNSNNSTLCAIDAVTLSYYSSEAAIRRAEGDKNPTKEGSKLRRTGELYTALKEQDYQIYQVSSHPGHYMVVDSLLPQSLMEQLMVSTTVDGLSVLDLAQNMSVLSGFSQLFAQKNEDGDTVSAQLFNASFRTRVLSVYDYYDNPENLCFKNKTALFTYILCPHTPFVFDAEGNNVPSRYRRNWTNPAHYAAQHQYITVRTQNMIENILKTDPDAIILLQSDHGVRGGYFVNKGLQIDYADQRRIYNALYFGGEPVDIEGLTAVNTLRLILTKLGADYPMLAEEGVQPFYYNKQNEMLIKIEDVRTRADEILKDILNLSLDE